MTDHTPQPEHGPVPELGDIIPFADDATVVYAEGTADDTVGPMVVPLPTTGSMPADAIPSTSSIEAEGPSTHRRITPGAWVVRCCECDTVRTTAELGVKVSRARVFHARITAYCTTCEWMRRHAVERTPHQDDGVQARSARPNPHQDSPSR